MSNESPYQDGSFHRASHTLKIIADQMPSEEDLKILHNGYLTDLLRAIQDGTLPDRKGFRCLLNMWPEEIPFEVGGADQMEEKIALGKYAKSFTRENWQGVKFKFSGEPRRVIGKLFRPMCPHGDVTFKEMLE